MLQVVEEAVTVPAVGAKVAPELTVKELEKEKFWEGWVAGVPAMTKGPLNHKLPEALEILQVVEEAVTVPEGANVIAPVKVKAPVKEKLAEGWTVGVAAMVKLKKLKAPLLERVQVVEEAVIMPAVGAKVAPELTVKELLKEKPVEGWVAGVPAMTKGPVKYKVPLLVKLQVVEEAVTVPVGATVLVEFTVNSLVKEKLAVGCAVGVPATVKL